LQSLQAGFWVVALNISHVSRVILKSGRNIAGVKGNGQDVGSEWHGEPIGSAILLMACRLIIGDGLHVD